MFPVGVVRKMSYSVMHQKQIVDMDLYC